MRKKSTGPKKNNVRHDAEFMRKIGAKGGAKTKRRRGKEWFSKIAKLSHPKNNKDAQRKTYVGGRPHNT